MNSFPAALKIRAFSPAELKEIGSARQLYEVLEDFRYLSDVWGEIVVPARFVTDFASIPAGALWYVDDDSPAILFASVVHDYLYTRRGDLGLGARISFNREQADQVLREAMVASGARKAQAWVVFKAVQAFGGGHWK